MRGRVLAGWKVGSCRQTKLESTSRELRRCRVCCSVLRGCSNSGGGRELRSNGREVELALLGPFHCYGIEGLAGLLCIRDCSRGQSVIG